MQKKRQRRRGRVTRTRSQPAAVHEALVLPAEGFLRCRQILGDPKAKPPVPAIFPVSHSTWWAGVKSGRFPQPVRMGSLTLWRVQDIRRLLYERA